MNVIDSIIFDLGGVIINLQIANTIAAFSQLSKMDCSQPSVRNLLADAITDYERGGLSSREFRNSIRRVLKVNCCDQDIDNSWNAMLLDIPPARVELLNMLRKQKRIFLLSNTNEIHRVQFERIFTESYGHQFENLSALFEQAYFSYLMGDCKPNPSIFQRIIDEQQLTPSRTLFIDDNASYIEGAKTVGLQTIHLTDGLTLEDLDLSYEPRT